MGTFGSRLKFISSNFRRNLISYAGIWLLLLYAVFSAFVVLSFSAFQLQQAIHSYKVAKGMPVELRSITDLYGRWKVNSAQMDAETERYNIISEYIRQKILMGRDLETNMSSYYADCRADINNFLTRLQKDIAKTDPVYGNILSKYIQRSSLCRQDQIKDFLDRYLRRINAVGMLQRVQNPLDAKDPRPPEREGYAVPDNIRRIVLDTDRTDINRLIGTNIDQAKAVYAVIVNNTTDVEKWRNEQRDIRAQLEDLRRSTGLLFGFGGNKFDDGIGDYLTSLAYFEGIEKKPYIGWLIPDFSKMPPDTLTLILVLSMGALGGTIQLSRRHLKMLETGGEMKIQGTYYLFRPFLGAITALSVFILVKAGVLVASIPSPSGDTANLSPFFISFLGIISGLLAEQALETIERVGGGIFNSSETTVPLRYAYGLDALLSPADADESTREKNVAALASSLGKSDEEIRKWANETEKVDGDSQRLVAAYFHLPMRQLFTDIPR